MVGYVESGDFGTELSRLRSKTDGHMDQVHGLRDQYGADLVALIIDNNQYCGIAYLMTTLSPGFESNAFSVTWYQCATGNYSFGHELGHNMGCAHDRQNASGGVFPYSFGYRFFGQGGGQYRTIMAYAPGTRIQRFSNPDVLFDGTPTGRPVGAADSAHNALSINNAASTVALWRECKGSCTGLENIKKAKCKVKGSAGKLKVVLAGGEPGDSYEVRLSSGQSASGALNAQGGAKESFSGLPLGAGTATATWGCSASDSETYNCS